MTSNGKERGGVAAFLALGQATEGFEGQSEQQRKHEAAGTIVQIKAQPVIY